MKRIIIFSIAFSVQLLFAFVSLDAQTVLIKNAQILDFEKKGFVRSDVLIKNGIIDSISTNINADDINANDINHKDIEIIYAEGKYLLPGFIDSHIHIFQSGSIYTRPDGYDLTYIRPYPEERKWVYDNTGDFLKRYLRLGITSVIDLGGPMYNFELRSKYKESKDHSNLYLTGPLISTYQPDALKIDNAPIIKVSTPEEARELVREQLKYDPDFIKIWYIVSEEQTPESNYEIVRATIDESHKNNKRVAVYSTQLQTAKLAIKAGADFLVHSIDDPIDDEFIKLAKDHNVILCPTLIVHRKYGEVFTHDYQFISEDFMFSPPLPLGTIFDHLHLKEDKSLQKFYDKWSVRMEGLDSIDKIRRDNLKKIHKNGIKIATGTDAGNIGTLHASSYYQEIDNMVNSGLSNYDIIEASTLNAAKTIAIDDEVGDIRQGLFADLLLLNSNPIDDIEAIKDLHLIIKKGKVHVPDEILIETPENLAAQQLNAYNARDIEAFLYPYSDDVEIYEFPNKLRTKGKDKMKPIYEKMFNEYTELHCELINRIVLGNTVIDQEKVQGFPGQDFLHAIAIYKIENGKIAKVYFIK